MAAEPNTIQIAEFNPKIKGYLLVVVALFLILCVISIPLLVIWFLGLGQYICRIYYENLKCQLTDRHLQFNKGAFFKVEKTIPLENIQDLTFIDNPILKYFDLRILKIETAGHSNPHGSDMKLIGIIDAGQFKEKILLQREMLQKESQNDTPQQNAEDNQIVDTLKEIKEILIEIKNRNQ